MHRQARGCVETRFANFSDRSPFVVTYFKAGASELANPACYTVEGKIVSATFSDAYGDASLRKDWSYASPIRVTYTNEAALTSMWCPDCDASPSLRPIVRVSAGI